MTAAEDWRPVLGFEGLYEVSSLGRVRSDIARRGDGLMRGGVDRYGYSTVLLTRAGKAKRFRIHRLVCVAFHGEPSPEKPLAAHLDGVKGNNTSDNLAWASYTENALHKRGHGTSQNAKNTKLTAEQVRYIRTCGKSHRQLSRELSVSDSTIGRAKRGENWSIVI